MVVYIPQEITRAVQVNAVVTAFDVAHPKGFVFAGERHDFWEAVCVADGCAVATADDRVYPMNRGDILFHKPMEFHRIRSEGERGVHLLILSFQITGEVAAGLENGFFRLGNRQIEEFAQTVRQFRRFLETSAAPERAEHRLCGTRAALQLERFLLSLCLDGHRAQADHTRYALQYRQIIRFLETHCHESVTVEEVARACNSSPSNVKRIFRMFCDRGVIAYHNSLRIQQAMRLLDEGVSAADISDRLGFACQSYFQTVFKRETGQTPRQYRNRL